MSDKNICKLYFPAGGEFLYNASTKQIIIKNQYGTITYSKQSVYIDSVNNDYIILLIDMYKFYVSYIKELYLKYDEYKVLKDIYNIN